MVPGNHALQQSRDRAVEHQQPTLTPVRESACGLACKRGAYIACADATCPVSGVRTSGMSHAAATFSHNAQPPQKKAV